MVVRRPVVSVSGLRTELPPGDTIAGASPGTIVSGSGVAVDGAGNLGAVVELDVAIAPNPSGLIIVGNKLANDGSALRTGQTALASGNQALENAEYALASGNAAISVSATALASGNAALVDIAAGPAGAVQTFTASSVIQAGNPVGLDDLGKASVITTVTDANSRSFGSAVVFESADTKYISSTHDSTNNRVVIAYRDGGNSSYGTAVVGTVSGTSISFGTPVVYASVGTTQQSITYDSTNNRVVIAYSDGGSSDYGTAIVGTVSGTSISFGTAVVFNTASSAYLSAIYDSTNNKVVISYRDSGNSNYGTTILGTVSGTSISFNASVVFESATSNFISATYDSTNDRVVIAYSDSGNSSYGTAAVGAPGSSTLPTISSRNNFIGISQSTVASGAAVSVRLPGSPDQNNTGLLAGSGYYVDPTTSGFTTTSTQPASWSGAVNWGVIGRAVNSTTLLLTDML